MDRNSLIGLFLIGLLIIGYSLYNQPSPEEVQANKRREDSLNLTTSTQQSPTPDKKQAEFSVNQDTAGLIEENIFDSLANSEAEKKYGIFSKVASGKEEVMYIENEVLKIGISSKGGSIASVELKNYKTHDSLPLMLITPKNTIFNYQFFANNRVVNTQDIFFSKENGDGNNIIIRSKVSETAYIEQIYSLKSNSYLVDYSFNWAGFENIVSASNNYVSLNWEAQIINQEQSLKNEREATTVYYKYTNDDPDYLSERGEQEAEKLSTPIRWISFKQQFFNATLIAETAFDEGSVAATVPPTDEYVKKLQADLIIPFSATGNLNFPMQFYLGPNDYQTLKSFDIDLGKIVPLGWGIFRWVNKFLIIPVFDILNNLIGNYGLIILILTVLIKLLLFPFTYKSYLSTAKMKVIQPEVNVLKEKYGNDAQKMNTEQMKLFRSAGVNPLGGCLPMLLQMPILIAMYSFFPSSIELRQESFLWANDLSTYDSILQLPFNIPYYGDHVSLFTILMTLTTFLSMQANSQMSAGNPQMKVMQYVMPVIFLPLFNNFPAGLTYYYFLSNVITFIQQQVIKKFMVNDEAIRRRIEENKKKPVKKSKFQKKLEDIAKTQQAKNKRKR